VFSVAQGQCIVTDPDSIWKLHCIYQWLDQPTQIVVILLLLMLICVMAFAINRIVRFHTIRKHKIVFEQAVGAAFRRGDLSEVLSIAESCGNKYMATLAIAGLGELRASMSSLSNDEVIEFARRILKRADRDMESDLMRGMNLLATIGYIAP
jgi:biopolymer transport protein ExbB/TolQ